MLQVQAGSYGIQAMVLQGFWVRGGVDSTLIEAQFDFTTRADSFQSIGGANGLWTFTEVPPVQSELPSLYEVLSAVISLIPWDWIHACAFRRGARPR